MINQWREGNEFILLENGEHYFPRVIQEIQEAKNEILLETFILFDDKVGQALRSALMAAARRGVIVDVTVDGYGSDALTADFISGLTDCGVRFHIFDPYPRIFGMRTNLFRRMHRKIVSIDGLVAFVGGINFSADQLADFGPEAKQDYAIEIRGPLVADIQRFARDALGKTAPSGGRRLRRKLRKQAAPAGDTYGRLVIRDNDKHSKDIERSYRAGIRLARSDIMIANAYFFPGYRLLRDLARAARRGVRVRLILQGQPDILIAQFAASMLYQYLIDAGASVYEYCQRPLHGKVACVDDTWSTIGSSNLDPLSLALNLEANVFIQDRAFTGALRQALEDLLAKDCRPARVSPHSGGRLRRLWVGVVIFHFLRRFPAWAGSLPAHKPELKSFIAADVQSCGEAGHQRTV
ncbi:cardiolipin synthase ClsB [Alcaligenaceae bacterium CGII-47]|nr:cardiolipin synthase ClsB [Alcaligenaceae bacterium CGII-47]